MSGAARARPCRFAKTRDTSVGTCRFWKCSRTDSSTRAGHAPARPAGGLHDRARSAGGPARRGAAGPATATAAPARSTAATRRPARSRHANRASTRLANDGTRHLAAGHREHLLRPAASCRVLVRVQPLPQPLPPLGVLRDVAELARVPVHDLVQRGEQDPPLAPAERPEPGRRLQASRPRRTRAQASRSTSVTVSASSGWPAASRTVLMTARFSRTGIFSGCGPDAQYAPAVASEPRSSPLSGTRGACQRQVQRLQFLLQGRRRGAGRSPGRRRPGSVRRARRACPRRRAGSGRTTAGDSRFSATHHRAVRGAEHDPFHLLGRDRIQ